MSSEFSWRHWLTQVLLWNSDVPWAWLGISTSFLIFALYQRAGLTEKVQKLASRALDRVLRPRHSPKPEIYNPPLLQKHSSFQSYSTNYATYPSIRTFYHPHAQVDKLPEAHRDLPLLVFCHGLGGSLAQFAPLLGSLINVAPCLGIDLPGNGLSEFSPKSWEAYSIEAMTTLVARVIEKHQTLYGHQKVVLIGHSMGCSHAAFLASVTSPLASKLTGVTGIISVCPKVSIPNRKQTWYFKKMLTMPDLALNLMRWFDRRGGTSSRSVRRFVGETAHPNLKILQLQFNSSFPTAVWKRIAFGALPSYDSAGNPKCGIPGRTVWVGIKVPLLLVAGQSDTVTKPEEVFSIVSYLKDSSEPSISSSDSMDPSPKPDHTEISGIYPRPQHPDGTCSADKPSTLVLKSQHSAVVKTAVLPPPASHALLYDESTYRTLAGIIESFLSNHVSSDLDLGWQLQQLTSSGKWDVKNLKKWQSVAPVSEPIAGIFRGIKTLREQDVEHTPAVFAKAWRDRIFALVDISHDTPVYDSRILETNGIQYHKFPTVSKIPPTITEVQAFISLIDRLREDIKKQNVGGPKSEGKTAIAVHCHYGYNRTGFFIASYLIEKEGYRVQDAIEEFSKNRPPGIRHEHFLDTLFVRYCVGLNRAASMKADT